MEKPILISGATLLDPAADREGQFDLLIEGGKVAAVDKPGAFANLADKTTINGTGRHLFPGFIDLHVHFREPGFEWKETIETGSRAAVAGGVTTVACMPNTNPVVDNGQVAKFVIERGLAAGIAKVHPIGAVTIGQKGELLAPLKELADAGCVAFSDDGQPVSDSGVMRRALEWGRITGRPIFVHEEVKSLTKGGSMHEGALQARLGLGGFPNAAEDIMVARDIELVRLTGGWLHILHLSSGRSVELIRKAKADGVRISCEVAPHNLVLTDAAVAGYNTNAKMYPPLRSQEDALALIEGLKDGTIDLVATDHAPHDLDSKRVEFDRAAFGITGLQTLLPVMLSLVRAGKLSLRRVVESLTAAPRRQFGLEVGRLQPGDPADLVLVDLEAKWQLNAESNYSKSANSPWWGAELTGRAMEVFVNGAQVVANGKPTR